MKPKNSNSNDSKKSKWTRDTVSDLMDHIEKNRDDLGAIHAFVDQQLWKKLGYKSLKECTDNNPDLPSDSQMGRIHRAVEYQKEYLPQLGNQFLKEGVIRPICNSKIKEPIQKRVAQKILKSADPYKLKKSDIESFIKSSKVILKSSHKQAAADFAANLVSKKIVGNLVDYFQEQGFKSGRKEVFLKRLSFEIKKEINSQL